ncbi:tetratricopeptide repeat protein [Brumimicrobium sp.]|uniref:tetratricopeptide repeat-containing sensor histidine kinase n=1 Tax=Brumimicrobium sp. TaxID=2029867 RepID=UPI003A909393
MKHYKCRLFLLFVFFQCSHLAIAKVPLFGFNNSEEEVLNIDHFEQALTRLVYLDSIQEIDSLIQYIPKAKALCGRINKFKTKDFELLNAVGDVYDYIAYWHYKNNQLTDALVDFTHAHEIYLHTGNKRSEATALNNKAVIYSTLGNKIESLKNFHKTINIFLDLGDSTGIVTGYSNIAKIYRQQKDFQSAQNYLEKAGDIVRNMNKPLLLSRIINGLGGIKREMGELELALSLYREALALTKSAGNQVLTAQILNNIGVVYLEKEDYKEALKYFEESYEIANSINSEPGKGHTLNNLAKYYTKNNNTEKALDYAKEALKIGKTIKNDEIIRKSTALIFEIYQSQENWKEAFIYQELLMKQNQAIEKNAIDQVAQQELIRLKLENDRFLAETELAKQTIAIEKKNQRQSILYILLGVLFVLLLVALFIIYLRLRSSRERNKYITRQSEERKLLLKEVHHRVKNNFQIVSSMLRLQSYNFDNEELRLNFDEAVNRINAMAIVHDAIYRQEKFKDIDSKTYLEKLIEQLKNTGDHRVLFEVDSEEIPFKIETLINLGIALNEMITNSFKHAFNQDNIQPKIFISFHAIGEKEYEINYKDNGIGISKETYTSNFGMDLIETIFENYEGEMKLVEDQEWNTSIKITFKEF